MNIVEILQKKRNQKRKKTDLLLFSNALWERKHFDLHDACQIEKKNKEKRKENSSQIIKVLTLGDWSRFSREEGEKKRLDRVEVFYIWSEKQNSLITDKKNMKYFSTDLI